MSIIGIAIAAFCAALCIALLPVWPHSRHRGYVPAGVAFVLMMIGVIVAIVGAPPHLPVAVPP